jgi:glycerol-3-phosphate dehydrogenase (NAD(P)+)
VSSEHRIAIIGAGSYGTCLAKHLGDKGFDVALWCRSESLAASIHSTRENEIYLPGFSLPETVTVSTDLEQVVSERTIVVGVTPSHAVRSVMTKIAPVISDETVVVNASKGLEEKTLDRMDEIYTETLREPCARRAVFLSGPTFAKEVAATLPSAIVVAGRVSATVETVQKVFSSDRFRAYSSDDVIGVQIGGALKNVIAIAAGISDGLGFGNNARAALITRGLAEITRIGTKLGANPLTFAGPDYDYEGSVDDVRVYRSALTQEQMLEVIGEAAAAP